MDQLSQTIWDGLWIIEGLVRLWLICGTADAIQDSVGVIMRDYVTSKLFTLYKFGVHSQARTSINTLRHLRVSTTCTGSKRIQVITLHRIYTIGASAITIGITFEY